LGPYGTASQLQQRPAPRGGGFFKRHWFEIVDFRNADIIRQVRFWDLAATKELKHGPKSNDPDFTVGTLLTEASDGFIYVEDVVRVRDDPPIVEKTVGVTAQMDGQLKTRIFMEEEPGSAGKSQISHYARNVLRGFSFRGIRSTGAKEMYADIFAGAAEQGRIRLVRGPWIPEWLGELEVFPKGAHDDQVDSAAKGYFQLSGKPMAGVWGGTRGTQQVTPQKPLGSRFPVPIQPRVARVQLGGRG
jgi:predicted phage terminase large subunit-like protein